jgi:TonB family protein
MSNGQKLFWVLASVLGLVGTSTAATPVDYTPPVPTVTHEALYPINSVAMGTVSLVVAVEEDGHVSEVRVIKSIPSLDEPSIKAAKQWRFDPARVDGKAIRSKASINFVFDRGLTPFNQGRQGR